MIWLFYHDPGANIFIHMTRLYRFSEQHLKQSTQGHHGVTVASGNNFL